LNPCHFCITAFRQEDSNAEIVAAVLLMDNLVALKNSDNSAFNLSIVLGDAE